MQLPGARAMSGTLFEYAPGRQCFVSGGGALKKCAILIGGLSDGLLACPYYPALAAALEARGWATAQPVLRSSYHQFGFGSLDDDAADVREVVDALGGVEEVALVGHSTGAQIAAHFVATGGHPLVRSIVFQGGVSDRETDDAAEVAKRKSFLDRADVSIAAGDGEAFLPRDAFWAPMTARRYRDLVGVGGLDDYFSSDMSDEALAAKFAGFADVAALVAYSGADEYAPPSVDKATLVGRICAAVSRGNTARVAGLVVPGGTHNLGADACAAPAFVAAVTAFLAGEPIAGALCDTRDAS